MIRHPAQDIARSMPPRDDRIAKQDHGDFFANPTSLPADVRNFRKSGQRIGGFLAIPRTHRRKAVAKEQVVRRQRAI
jgi:hypothetical protein